MEGLIAELKVWVPLAVGLCSLIGICITIFLLGWRIPSKTDMNRADDNLQQQINHVINLNLAVNKEIREDMRQIVTGLNRGVIKPAIHQTYPLSNAADAHRDMEATNFFGKLLLQP